MKEISFKKIILAIVLLFLAFIIVDVVMNWDEAVASFNRGYQDMNQINEQ